ncbi:MAG TPA: HAMP domain-containing sensor histidine kinase [Tepidisphaeraceae bacterium]|nr:HAMP domain-containing sensor histidine kinase [Tepidisphaeraceae bacterium]
MANRIPSDTDPTTGPLGERPFPELAEALRSRIASILREWEGLVRQYVPSARIVSFDEVLDSQPDILNAVADALASGDPAEVARLMERSPAQGIHRYQIHYDVRELATEDRILRRLTMEHVEDALGRRPSRAEDIALNWAIDLIWQQAMVAFVNYQNERLRAAAEAELTYLSFLSHEVNNKLATVTLSLKLLRMEIDEQRAPAEKKLIDDALLSIHETVQGTRRLLQHERLRKVGHAVQPRPVDLREFLSARAHEFSAEAEQKGVRLKVEVPAGRAVVTTDPEMVTLVLRNLVGNAIKYAPGHPVRLSAQTDENGARWTLSVSDQGPGIPPEHLDQIFEAFHRGNTFGQEGIGLGLAIASRAADLLNAELSIESRLGEGATFSLRLPAV